VAANEAEKDGIMKANNLKRHGFTLIELMVVIVILAILATLVTRAVSSAIGRAKEAAIKLELDQLAGAIESYKAKYGTYPPGQGGPNVLRNHVQSLFPRALAEDLNTLPGNLTPAEILWFCVRGYTSDPQRPVDFFNENVKRDQFTNFDTGRLVETPTSPWRWRPGMTPTTGLRVQQARRLSYVPVTSKEVGERRPYVYFDCSRPTFYSPQIQAFSSRDGDTVRPYRKPDRANNFPFINAGKFQIVSAGLDDNYGEDIPQPNEEENHKMYPDGFNYSNGDSDNLVNFSERNLENSKP
jgi:prepilin-type N-terminal cleavage/methylation domain-containing protein